MVYGDGEGVTADVDAEPVVAEFCFDGGLCEEISVVVKHDSPLEMTCG